MKKIIILVFVSFILFGCNVENEKNKENEPERTIIEQAENYSKGPKAPVYYKTNKKLTEKWGKEGVGKLTCKSGTFILNQSENEIQEFQNDKETIMLQKKVDKFGNRKDIIGGFSYFISEFCRDEKQEKYIFWTQDKPIFKFGRYDKILDIIEPAEFKYNVFNHIGGAKFFRGYNIALEKYYDDYVKKHPFSGIGKREGNKVFIKDFGKPITDSSDIPEGFLKEKNIKYCLNGLTPAGNKAICFANVYYSYDFVKNILTEDKVCSYYINDSGEIKVLEKCREFSY